jgi:DNA-binding NarL/FixJ family response regulator
MAQKILLVDDSPYIADVVIKLLAGDYELSVAHNTAEMMQQLAQDQFDLIVLDLDLADGVRVPSLLPTIKRHCGKVVIFSNTIDQRDFDACVAGAADGYLVKNGPIDELKRAVGVILSGHQAYPGTRLATYAQHGGGWWPDLSRSEAAVLAYLTLHPRATNREIGDGVFLSEGRVGNILTSLYRLFHADDRHALVAAAKALSDVAGQAQAEER